MSFRNAGIVLIFLFGALTAAGQTVSGTIVDAAGVGLPGAKVWWLGSETGTLTDSLGYYSLPRTGISDERLIVSLTDFGQDTVDATGKTTLNIRLIKTAELGAVRIQAQQDDSYISSMDPIKTEVISKRELEKGACCDLAGCFNTNASVTPMTTNVITNSTELRILGLAGVYNQILFDGMPLIQGLSYTYGISSIPGPLVENIFVAKGANSVLQGFESIAGQINVIPKSPKGEPPLFLNGYFNSFRESQFNAIAATPLGKRKEWKFLGAFHSSQPGGRFDRDQDGFLDLPRITRYSGYGKFTYRDEKSFGWHSNIGMTYLDEQRQGGQTEYRMGTDEGSATLYGQTVQIRQPGVYTKTGYRFNAKSAVNFMGSAFYQTQDSWFGQTNFEGRQFNAYANAQYERRWAKDHDFKTGASLRRMRLEEDISFTENPLAKTFAGTYLKDEWIPGAFAENVFRWFDAKLTWIAGARLDWHNQFGPMFSPRTLLKYNATDKTVIRGSAGYGWRTANIWSENIKLLASQREVIFTEQLRPEEAWNYGLNAQQSFYTESFSGSVSADFYQTRFVNQIFPDYNTDRTKAFIGNFTGTSISNGFQTDVKLKFIERLSANVSYNFLEVYRIEDGQKTLLPFVSRHKVLSSLSYQPLTNSWQADVNVHWYGVQQLPDTDQLPANLQTPGESRPYTTINAQFSKFWPTIELYGGVENLLDFRQKRPIIGWQDPFGPWFDTSSVWGPTRGREFYVGIRWRIKQ